MTQPFPTLIYRMTHYSNVAAILQEGIFCANHPACQTRTYRSIGYTHLIARRGRTPVPVAQGGVLNDYVPFYLSPRGPMLYAINESALNAQSEVVYLVSSVQRIEQLQLPFAFTDGHACEAPLSVFYDDAADLSTLHWEDIQSRQYKVDIRQYPHRYRRKQAEFLVHQHVPVNALLGIAVYNDQIRTLVEGLVQQAGIRLPVGTRPLWYY